jgi:hypothetical protein
VFQAFQQISWSSANSILILLNNHGIWSDVRFNQLLNCPRRFFFEKKLLVNWWSLVG